jgi:DNA-directed RNA polymerase specialized sigma24 family protein
MQRLPFETTHWSLIMAAGGADSAAARVAIARLCEKYWYPLYAYARRQGLDPDDARDLTQGFLTSLLERRDIENVRQERGRFRSFLLASLKHFIANDALGSCRGRRTELRMEEFLSKARDMGVSLMTTASLERCRSSSQQNDM